MAAKQSAARRWTEAEFEIARDAAPGGERWELVDGEVLVTPSQHWRHQAVVGLLFIRLREYVRAGYAPDTIRYYKKMSGS